MTIHRLKTPLSEQSIRELGIGDIVYLTGLVVTARDAAHRRIVEYLKNNKPLPVDLRNGVIYHCGPVVKKTNSKWEVVAAGPTTSTRMELYEAEVIEKTGVRIIIGKGGMGSKTSEACRKHGAVYTTFTGGAGALAANSIEEVVTVEWLDLGVPEALWVFKVRDFGPLLVAIDSNGTNLIQEVIERAQRKRSEILAKLGLV